MCNVNHRGSLSAHCEHSGQHMNAALSRMQAQVRSALAGRVADVHMLCIDPRPFRDASDALCTLLSAAELARVRRKRREQDRRLLSVAYAFHRIVVAELLTCDPATVRIERDSHGCPQLPDTACRTSLSHCDEAVAVGFARQGPVGVDVEPTRRSDGMLALAAQVCSAEEWRALAVLPTAAREPALLRLWVRKEAVLKALGVGLARAMSSFAIDAHGRTRIADGVTHVLQVHDWVAADDLVLALAAARGQVVSLVRA